MVINTSRPRPLPAVSYLRSRLRLNRKTGDLYWKRRPPSHFTTPKFAITWNKKHAGKPAGADKGRGYKMIRIDRVAYQYHRIVFAMSKGYDPGPMFVDHRDGEKGHNAPRNLQPATNAENLRKRRGPGKNNTSGVVGVSWHKASDKWLARIRVRSKDVYLGVFTDITDAARARRKAEKLYFGAFAPNTKRRKTWA